MAIDVPDALIIDWLFQPIADRISLYMSCFKLGVFFWFAETEICTIEPNHIVPPK
jgi:hypothetical protein